MENSQKNGLSKKDRKSNKVKNIPIGRWYQFFTDKDDIFSLTYEALSNVIEDISNVDPRTISIFIGSSLGRSITQNYNQTILDNFVEFQF